MIRTGDFAIAPSATAAFLARQWLERRWFLFALPTAVLLLWGMFDVRMAIEGLMLIFVVWPMALSAVWFGQALDAASVTASMLHCVEFDEAGMTIRYVPCEERATPAPEAISWERLMPAEHGKKTVTFRMKGSRRVIIVPASALPAEAWRQVMAWSV